MIDSNLTARYTPKRVEELLMWWANLADPESANFMAHVGALIKKFPEIFAELRGTSGDAKRESTEFLRALWGMRTHLRTVWWATDQRARTWYIHETRRLFVQHSLALGNPDLPLLKSALHGRAARDRIATHELPNEGRRSRELESMPGGALGLDTSKWVYIVEPPPPLTIFERVMFHFEEIAHRARQCRNPECAAPFFFVRRKGQEFCSEECALPAQRRAKSEWWARNRENQMKKRRRKAQQGKKVRT
jgi:hypothetical protein